GLVFRSRLADRCPRPLHSLRLRHVRAAGKLALDEQPAFPFFEIRTCQHAALIARLVIEPSGKQGPSAVPIAAASFCIENDGGCQNRSILTGFPSFAMAVSPPPQREGGHEQSSRVLPPPCRRHRGSQGFTCAKSHVEKRVLFRRRA